MIATMYPLRFEPLFRHYLWGGRRLADILHKPIGPETAAESWEIVDHDDDQSVVAHGPLAGKTLRQLITESGNELLGQSVLAQLTDERIPPQLRGRFPLLFKFLDANQNLSVQVHPDDKFGATLTPPDLGKTEAWYVMHADPGAKIYAGLKSGISKADFAVAIAAGSTESVLHSFEAKTGDCVFIPAGTMHAIGAGLLIAEIQQSSNTTFRVYDWNRVDRNGNARPLHIESAIAVTDFTRGPIQPVAIAPADSTGSSILVSCDKFILEKISLTQPSKIGGDGQFRLLAITAGELTIDGDPSNQPLKFGQTALLPASLPELTMTPGSGGVELLTACPN
jgi:mannose-6-phosphate isomerase